MQQASQCIALSSSCSKLREGPDYSIEMGYSIDFVQPLQSCIVLIKEKRQQDKHNLREEYERLA